jgi:hypothetical protein
VSYDHSFAARRPGLEVGQLYAVTEPGPQGDVVIRAIRVTAITDGTATGTVVRWRGKPKLLGTTVILPDDARYKLADETVLGPPRKVRRKSALKDHA